MNTQYLFDDDGILEIDDEIEIELDIDDEIEIELELDIEQLSFWGTSEKDTFIGKKDSEVIVGLGGNDSLVGKDGNDFLFGGTGNDTIASGRGNNLLLGEEGNDFLAVNTIRRGQAGNNTLDGGVGNDTLMAGDGNDILVGREGNDFIDGSLGNDYILGNQGADSLFGGQGKDTIKGGSSDDDIQGGDGDDRLHGDKGNDTLIGGEGIDTLIGGRDSDSFVLIPNTGISIIQDFQKNQDIFVLQSTNRFGKELTFEQLAITDSEAGAIITIAETEEVLAVVKGISANNIEIEDFIVSDNPNPGNVPVNAVSLPNDTGLVVSQAVEVMKVDVAREVFGVEGKGITIGVIANSFDRSQIATTTASKDVLSGNLPGTNNPSDNDLPVTILDDSADNSFFNLADEGRAMIQLIHDVAPGANFIFHSGFNGAENTAQGIDELVAAGADIIVDDVFFPEEPFFQDGVIAQAVDRAFAAGVPYFSAAGNSGRNSYESDLRLVESNEQINTTGLENYRFHDFDPGTEVDILQDFTLNPGTFISMSFQWDSPFASAGGKGATSDLDIFLLDENNNIVTAGVESNIGFDAVETLQFVNPTNTATEYKILIGQNITAGDETPNLIKYIDFGGGTVGAEYFTFSSTVFGHPNASGAEAVGAAFYGTPTQLQPFSSNGGIPILFDRNGDRLSEPEIRPKPQIVAPDGVNNTFFGSDIEGDGFPNFFGTSAAAPHAAGVAALLLEANPDATPELIYQALEQSAIDLNDPLTPGEDIGVNPSSGFGLIQADLAVEAVLI